MNADAEILLEFVRWHILQTKRWNGQYTLEEDIRAYTLADPELKRVLQLDKIRKLITLI
jgi:hypothetical protein